MPRDIPFGHPDPRTDIDALNRQQCPECASYGFEYGRRDGLRQRIFCRGCGQGFTVVPQSPFSVFVRPIIRYIEFHSVRRNSRTCEPANLVSQALLALYLTVAVASLAAVEVAAGVPLHPTLIAVLNTGLVASLLPIFFVASFSFGYVVGVAFYGMIAGFVWLTCFSTSVYDHGAARWSAIASLLAFSVPALFQVRPAVRLVVIKPKTMELVLKGALCVAGAILALNMRYGFALVGIQEAALLRGSFARPTALAYVTTIAIYAVLPFSFAYFAQRGSRYMAAASLLLILSFYPTLLNKTVLFAAVWLPFVWFIFRALEPKQASVVSLMIPLVLGFLLYLVGSWEPGSFSRFVFGYVNERMFGVPSIALDYYADFFAANPRTYFCHINLVRAIVGCPYSEQLGVVFASRYHVGNLNASLFATEGIASVGLTWAPAVAFLCGMVISLGNSLSRHLPTPVMATSAALGVQALLNVPLSTALLTNGLMMLFLLWYICPGERDEQFSSGR